MIIRAIAIRGRGILYVYYTMHRSTRDCGAAACCCCCCCCEQQLLQLLLPTMLRWQLAATALAASLCLLRWSPLLRASWPPTTRCGGPAARCAHRPRWLAEGHVRWSYAGVSASFIAIQSTEVYMQCGSTFTSGAAIVHVYLNGALHQEMALVNDIPPLTIATAAES